MTEINCFAPSFNSQDYTDAYRWIEEQEVGGPTESPLDRLSAKAEDDGGEELIWEDFEDELIERLDAECANGSGPSTWADREAELIEASDAHRFASTPTPIATIESTSDHEDYGPLKESIHKPQVSELIKEMRAPCVFERLGVDYWWSTVCHGWVEYHVGTGTPIRPSEHGPRSWKNAKRRASQHVKPHLSKRTVNGELKGMICDYERLGLSKYFPINLD